MSLFGVRGVLDDGDKKSGSGAFFGRYRFVILDRRCPKTCTCPLLVAFFNRSDDGEISLAACDRIHKMRGSMETSVPMTHSLARLAAGGVTVAGLFPAEKLERWLSGRKRRFAKSVIG